MNFEVKVVRPLAQFKNLKFLRLIYPLRSFRMNVPTSKIKFKKTLRKLLTKEHSAPKVKAQQKDKKNKENSRIALRKRYVLMGNRTKRFAKVNSIFSKINKKNTYVFKRSANKFQRLRRKELLDFTQSRLGEIRRQLIIRSFVPVASLFIKYLNPQLLADHIAKEFEKTKHHQSVIYGLAQALRALPFARAKGYRIAIIGRINSSDKSRSYLLKRNVLIRQDFSRKVNFASSQATYSTKIFIGRTSYDNIRCSLCPAVCYLPEIRSSVSLYLV